MSPAWEESALTQDLLRARDESACDEAFAALVRAHSVLLFRIAFTVLRNVQDAEDCVQDGLLKLYRGRAWQKAENPRAFLAKAVWRIALDRRRTQRRADPFPDSVSGDASPEQSAIAVDANARVHRLIDALPDELRQPLLLSAIEEMTSAEIGAILGVPDATVRNRIFRARQMLRQKWEALHA